MVYDEIIRLAEETQKIAREQKAQHYTYQTVDRMRLDRIMDPVHQSIDIGDKLAEFQSKLKTIHTQMNCVYNGEEDQLLIERMTLKRV